MHATLIKDLGGAPIVAGRLGLNNSTVANWVHRGIPWAFRHAVAALAAEKKVKLPSDFLGAKPSPPAEQRAS